MAYILDRVATFSLTANHFQSRQTPRVTRAILPTFHFFPNEKSRRTFVRRKVKKKKKEKERTLDFQSVANPSKLLYYNYSTSIRSTGGNYAYPLSREF